MIYLISFIYRQVVFNSIALTAAILSKYGCLKQSLLEHKGEGVARCAASMVYVYTQWLVLL